MARGRRGTRAGRPADAATGAHPGAFDERELWDETAQAVDPAGLERLLADGLAREWRRPWEHPIPYYRDVLDAAGFGPGEVPPLDEIPRTTKDDLRADEDEHPPFGRHRSVPLERAARLAASTGTTGKPWLITYSRHDLEVMLRLQLQHNWRMGLRPGRRFAHAWPGGLYPTAVLGGRQFLELGVLEIAVGPPFGIEQAADHVRLWRLLGIDALMCTGSQLQIYEEAAAGIGVDLREVLEGATLIFLEASCQFEEPRRRVESAYGVRLHNISGASEIPGFVTSDCRYHTGLHVPPVNYVLEVCDPATGKRVPPGERGTLVVTAVGLDAFFLRYDLEDIVVEAAGPCPCGQTGPRYTLIGRGADRALVHGRMILPLDVQLALEPHGAPEFVLRPGETEVLRLKVETEGRGGEVAQALKEVLDLPVEIEEIPVGTLPRSAFKPRRVAG